MPAMTKTVEKSKPARKSNAGRPEKTLNYSILSELVNLQCTGEECASVLKLDYDTINAILKREGHGNFSDYFKKHSGGGKASLRRMQWKAAQDGNTGMMIWLGKQYLDQKDHREENVTYRKAEPIEYEIID